MLAEISGNNVEHLLVLHFRGNAKEGLGFHRTRDAIGLGRSKNVSITKLELI
jgi:hypothetical protein